MKSSAVVVLCVPALPQDSPYTKTLIKTINSLSSKILCVIKIVWESRQKRQKKKKGLACEVTTREVVELPLNRCSGFGVERATPGQTGSLPLID